MGKSSSPDVPDYSPVTRASAAAASTDAANSASQLAWAKEQYAAQAPATQAYASSMADNSAAQSAYAQAAQDRYTSVYEPMQDKFAAEAGSYNSPNRANQAAGAAQADVASQFNQARASALSSLESYGIDPSQTRYGALDLGTRVSQAAATAAAGTQSRLQTEATGLDLQQKAIAMGSALPGQAQAAYSGAAGSGASGVNAGLNTASTYGNLMGTATQWAGAQNSALSGQTSALNSQFSNSSEATKISNQNTADTVKGVGQVVAIGAIAI